MNHTRTVSVAAFLAISLGLCGCKAGGNAEGAAEERAWQDTFVVMQDALAASGAGRYLRLEPGRTAVYKHADETLTITVLPETKVVDGITTRIVEEREERGADLVEVSFNYLAIDTSTGDVYYFGEEVDDYKNGKVVSHAGAWLAGTNGAHWGLLVPGAPSVGARFCEEIAPSIAMDRGEVVSVSERVSVAAGTFENCMHVVETSPLEKGKSHKWYAPGIGLVKDDDLELISVTPR